MKAHKNRVKDAPRVNCEWHLADEACALWEGACGVAWEFTEGGPKENGCQYCPRCGGKLKVVR